MGGGLGVGVVGFYAKQNNKQKNHVGWFLEDGLKGCRFSLLRKKPLFKKVRLGTSKSGFCLWKGICVFVTPFSMPIEQGLFKTCIYSPFFFKALYFVLGSISSNFSRVSRRPSFLEESGTAFGTFGICQLEMIIPSLSTTGWHLWMEPRSIDLQSGCITGNFYWMFFVV